MVELDPMEANRMLQVISLTRNAATLIEDEVEVDPDDFPALLDCAVGLLATQLHLLMEQRLRFEGREDIIEDEAEFDRGLNAYLDFLALNVMMEATE